MLGEVYEFTIERLPVLREKAAAVRFNSKVVEKFWISKEFRGRGVGCVVGVDGGRNWIECKNFVLYIVDAEAVIFEDEVEKGSLKVLDVDLLYPHRHVEDRVASYSEILEGKAAYKALQERSDGTVFMDGSIIGVLIRPPFRGYALGWDFERELKEYVDIMASSWSEVLEDAIFSKRMLEDVVKEYGEAGGAAASFLENAEKLLVYRRLLEEHGRRLVFVSKMSRGCDYFKFSKSDMSIFGECTKGAGYSLPLHLEISNKVKWRFPVFNEYFRDFKVTMFYARLEERGPVLRFEVPGFADEGKVEDVLAQAVAYSVSGYPYPLRKAHEEVKVSDEEARRVFRLVGFYEAERGREILE
ncbi:MAG: DNA double-strand break repair nuclease NurA [Candidatus Jordarchaeales archaeon]